MRERLDEVQAETSEPSWYEVISEVNAPSWPRCRSDVDRARANRGIDPCGSSTPRTLSDARVPVAVGP